MYAITIINWRLIGDDWQEVLPGDLRGCRLVQADGGRKVWLGGVNRHTGHVLLIARPALLDLEKTQSKRVSVHILKTSYAEDNHMSPVGQSVGRNNQYL